jgi:hypothetical protein
VHNSSNVPLSKISYFLRGERSRFFHSHCAFFFPFRLSPSLTNFLLFLCPVQNKQTNSFLTNTNTMAKTPAKSPKTKAKKAKKVKDPNAPKRNLSAYFFFMNDQRPKVVKANPDLKVTEVGKKLGELWRAMSDSEKAPYNKKADADKVRYEKQKAAYKPK